MENQLKQIGVHIPTILLPKESIDLTKWSVVACDQYTSQPEYWDKAYGIVGDSQSTLHMIFPEVYLEAEGKEERIQKINHTMRKYLEEGIVVPEQPGFIFVDRRTSHAPSRKGLILAVDLEKYDYNKGSQSLIRATEGTVLDRLPPRIDVRKNAPIELPHIMLLIDDREQHVIGPIAEKADQLKKLYDFDLMLDGMHVTGYHIDQKDMIEGIAEALHQLAKPEVFRERYGVGEDKGILLFAVGDGNHSLATAKACWENVKQGLSQEEIENHPARFALVEVVNVHDEGLAFEPIHRVVFNVNAPQMLEEMVAYFKRNGSNAYYKSLETKEAVGKDLQELRKNSNVHAIAFTTQDQTGVFVVEDPKYNLEVGTLQSFLDELVSHDENTSVDYIHGEEVVQMLGSKEKNIGFYLPVMDKEDLFKTVILDGVLPRKTFSMGEAEEKRFYLECKKICQD